MNARISGILFILLLLPPLAAFAAFERDLYFGLRNDADAVKLQEFLRGLGYFTYPESTGNFFGQTMEAVKKFQKAQGITPVSGYFGPLSRAAANGILAKKSSESIYAGKIKITSVSGVSASPSYEYLYIENRTKNENLDVTGFTLENSSGERFAVPKAHELPGFYASPQDDIILKPGGRVLIAAGKQERKMDFLQNLCTGYFDETSNFYPSLSRSCPRPDTKNLLYLSDRCLRLVSGASSCRTVSLKEFYEEDCSRYVSENLNYAGCVRNYRSRPDFYGKEWRVWMQRTSEFFRNVRENVILKDKEGKKADEYGY